MAIQLNIENYESLISSIQSLFSAGGISAVIVTMYDDADATVITNDAAGNGIANRALASAVKKDSIEGVAGSVTICFTDGSTIEVVEGELAKWYILSTKGYI